MALYIFGQSKCDNQIVLSRQTDDLGQQPLHDVTEFAVNQDLHVSPSYSNIVLRSSIFMVIITRFHRQQERCNQCLTAGERLHRIVGTQIQHWIAAYCPVVQPFLAVVHFQVQHRPPSLHSPVQYYLLTLGLYWLYAHHSPLYTVWLINQLSSDLWFSLDVSWLHTVIWFYTDWLHSVVKFIISWLWLTYNFSIVYLHTFSSSVFPGSSWSDWLDVYCSLQWYFS